MDVVGVGYVQLVRIPAEGSPHPNLLDWPTLPPQPWELVGKPGPPVHWAIETGPDGVTAHVLDGAAWCPGVAGTGYDIGVIDEKYGPLFAVGLNDRYLKADDEVSLIPR